MSLKTETFLSVNAVPISYWNDLQCLEHVYFTPEFFSAFQEANKDIGFNYIFVLKEDKAVAFAYTQLITIGIKTITKNIRMWSWLKNLINTLFYNSTLRILFCGNVFLSGDYGIFIKPDVEKPESFNAIAETIMALARKTRRLHALFIKDFEDERLRITDQLFSFGFSSMKVEPNMIIDLNPEWKNFDDFRTVLKSKYRIKANKADSKSNDLRSVLFSISDISKHLEALQNLYQNTIDNADFNAQILNLETYIHLKAQFKEQFLVKGYFLNDKLVGFLSAMQNNSHLDAHFIGIDYELNKTLGIYPRILNDYIRLGIKKQVAKINLGRTASEIKTTLGAKPTELTCYCRHRRFIPNQIIKPFIKNVKVKSFKQHQPFKAV